MKTFQRCTRRYHAHFGIPLLFKLSDMASKGPLTMAKDNVIRDQTSQTLLVVNFRALGFPDKGDGPDKWRACYAVWERQVENSDHHARYSGRKHWCCCLYLQERGKRVRHRLGLEIVGSAEECDCTVLVVNHLLSSHAFG